MAQDLNPAAEPGQPPLVPPRRGRLTVVMGAKGGCGATLLACNLAHQLASSQRVLLVDLDVGNGDVAAALDLHSGRSLNVVLDHLDQGDDALLVGAADHLPGGLHVLAQPYHMEDLRDLSADEARALLELCRGTFEHVVVDAGSTVHVGALAAVEQCDELLLVGSPDVPTLRDALRKLRLLHRLQVPRHKIRFVLNKDTPRAPVAVDEIEEQLGLPVAARVTRDDAAAGVADSKGFTLDRAAPRSKLTRDVAALWTTLRVDAPLAP